MKTSNTVEINGKLYDAKTGLPVNKKPTLTKLHSKNASKIKTIDGFSKTTKKISVVQPLEKSKNTSDKKTASEKASTFSRHQAINAHTKPKKSQTLHRRSVKAPNIITSSDHGQTPKPVSSAINIASSKREQRAKSINKSSAISRFGTLGSSVINKTETHSEPTPTASLTQHLAVSHLTNPVVSKPGTQTKEMLIKKAVDEAVNKPTAKKIKKHKKTSLTKFASAFAVILLLTGYVAYLNIPGISMKVAASRAGFTAALPGYTPGGYSLATPINYSPGIVSIDFHSNTDNRKFTLKQQPSTWDSTALLENFVSKKTKQYLTYQDRGLTIYIYDGSSAAWVNGGKMYSLEGNGSQLDTDQLLKLATSM